MTDPVPAVPAAHDRYAVLRIRDFQLYLAGRFIASVGQQMLGTAVGWELYERTRSSLALGIVGLVQIGPLILLTLPAGHVADQYDRRRIVVWTQGLFALSALGLTFVSWRQSPVAWTYVFLALGAMGRAFLWPATSAFLPELVPRELFPGAVTWNSGSFQISAAVGPALGGLLIAATRGATPVYVLATLSALACGGMFAVIRSQPPTAKPARMTAENLWTGLRFVLHTRIILATITLDLFAVLLGGAVALLPVYSRDILHVGPQGLGWLQAALPAGSASMAFFLAHRPPMQRAGRSLLLAVAAFGLATMIFGWSTSFWLSLAMMYVCGAADNVSVVVRNTLVQVLTPNELRGRVSAVNALFISSSNQFGAFESGLVANWLGPIFAVVSGGIGTVLVVVATAVIWPEMRRIKRLDTLPE